MKWGEGGDEYYRKKSDEERKGSQKTRVVSIRRLEKKRGKGPQKL